MNNNDTDTQRPLWATDAMNTDDIEFVMGYAQAVEWLPTATPEALEEHLKYSHVYNCFNDGGTFEDDGVVGPYSVGFAAALRMHRPREAKIVQLKIDREMIDAQLAGLNIAVRFRDWRDFQPLATDRD